MAGTQADTMNIDNAANKGRAWRRMAVPVGRCGSVTPRQGLRLIGVGGNQRRPRPHSITLAVVSPGSAAMSASDLLDDARLDRLSDLLDARAVPFKGFNLEALDGFLSAVAVSPDTVPMEEWQPVVWGGKPPRWDNAEEAAEVDAGEHDEGCGRFQ